MRTRNMVVRFSINTPRPTSLVPDQGLERLVDRIVGGCRIGHSDDAVEPPHLDEKAVQALHIGAGGPLAALRTIERMLALS